MAAIEEHIKVEVDKAAEELQALLPVEQLPVQLGQRIVA